MAKKGQASQLQAEINSEEDWDKLLQRDGLIIVDVYSEWCGPCSGMSANLKKIKLEIGGDNLHLAMAKSDNITALERFRDKSEPTWMFICKGKMVNLMFGPNAPKLQRLIIEELKELQQVREGAAPKSQIDITDLAEEERERKDKVDKVKLEAERVETEALEKALHERIVATCESIMTNYERSAVVVALPNCKDHILPILNDYWEANELFLHRHEKIILTQEGIDELMYFSKERLPEDLVVEMLDKQVMAMIIECAEDFTGDPIDKILTLFFGPMKQPPGSKDCLLHKIKETLHQQKIEAELAAKAILEMKSEEELVKKEVSVEGETENLEDGKSEAEEEKGGADGGKEETAADPIKADSGRLEKIKSKSETQVLEEDLSNIDPSAVGRQGSKCKPGKESKEDVVEEKKASDWYLWAPHDRYSTATAIKVLFPKMAEHYIVPEPEPIPPHIAVAYDAFKRKEIMDAIQDWPEDVMRYGFFSSEIPEEAKLIAKTIPKFEAKAAETTYAEKMVIQLSKKKSDVLLAFAQLGPTYMSPNTVDGKKECKMFFPDGYDDLTEEVAEVKKKPTKKKGKKGSVASVAPVDGTGAVQEGGPPTIPEGEEVQTAATSMQEGEGHPTGEGEGEEGEELGEGMEEEVPSPEEAGVLEGAPSGEGGAESELKSPSVAETIASKTNSKEGSVLKASSKEESTGSKQPSQGGVSQSSASQGATSQGGASQAAISQGAISKDTIIGTEEAGEADKATSPIAEADV